MAIVRVDILTKQAREILYKTKQMSKVEMLHANLRYANVPVNHVQGL